MLTTFIGNLRPTEILIIAAVVLLLFGGKKIPELMRGLGRGLGSFRAGVAQGKEEFQRQLDTSTDDAPHAASIEKNIRTDPSAE